VKLGLKNEIAERMGEEAGDQVIFKKQSNGHEEGGLRRYQPMQEDSPGREGMGLQKEKLARINREVEEV